jgi:spore germination protein GerM
MEPLVKGTEWKLPDGRKRYISGTEVTVDTPSGKYSTIEVTTEEDGGKSLDYYAPEVGLVKSVYISGDMEVTSTLSKINTNTPFTQEISIFYPDSDEKIYVEPLTLTFRTGDDTRLILEEALHQEAAKESYLPLASSNTSINELYLDKDNIVHVDFSTDLVKDMNAGAGYETLILQSITNTLGSYYGVDQVIITMDGKPYESGHILMKEGETLKVDMDKVIMKEY